MATKKARGEKGTSGEGKPEKSVSDQKSAKKRGADPSVTTFLKKLGGAPSTKGRVTPAKGLLGDMRRSDLVDAGRLSGSGEIVDEFSALDTSRTTVHVEVSSPGGPTKGRITDRTPYTAQVEVRSVFSPTAKSTRTVNLSVGGVFVETTEILELGDPVVLSFSTGDGGPLTVNGRVRWVTPFGGVDDAVPGMGISFIGLDESKRVRLERMLRKMPRTRAERALDDER
jgi:uncharacterized protein (TIGR02266 family)